ncbi:unnamed protein product [Diplocarpon coronariae]
MCSPGTKLIRSTSSLLRYSRQDSLVCHSEAAPSRCTRRRDGGGGGGWPRTFNHLMLVEQIKQYPVYVLIRAAVDFAGGTGAGDSAAVLVLDPADMELRSYRVELGVRGGKADYDAWKALCNNGWGLDNLLPDFKESENYTDNVDANFSRELYIQPDVTTYAKDGFFHVSYPRNFYNQSRPWTAGAINTLAISSLHSVCNIWPDMMADASTQNITQYLIPGLDRTIIAGFEAQKKILIDFISCDDVGACEILNDNIGFLSVAAMHTSSRGSVDLQSPKSFEQPGIDPRCCSNPIDSIQSGIRTEFHDTGTTSMMPLELGGVVDTRLRVYGTKSLRIVDAGIFPLVPAAHLQAPVYAVAEKAGLKTSM